MWLKTSLLVISEILELFFKTLTADDNYSCYQREKFPQGIEMELSKNLKIFYALFILFLETKSPFPHVEKKMSFIAQVVAKIFTRKKSGYLIV